MGKYGWSNQDGVATAQRYDPGESEAVCQNCDWFASAGRWRSVRARARRHAARTLHVVTAANVRSYVYAPEPLER